MKRHRSLHLYESTTLTAGQVRLLIDRVPDDGEFRVKLNPYVEDEVALLVDWDDGASDVMPAPRTRWQKIRRHLIFWPLLAVVLQTALMLAITAAAAH